MNFSALKKLFLIKKLYDVCFRSTGFDYYDPLTTLLLFKLDSTLITLFSGTKKSFILKQVHYIWLDLDYKCCVRSWYKAKKKFHSNKNLKLNTLF